MIVAFWSCNIKTVSMVKTKQNKTKNHKKKNKKKLSEIKIRVEISETENR